MSKIAIIILLLVGYAVIPVFAHVMSDNIHRPADNGKRTADDAKAPHLSLDSSYLDLGKFPRDSVAEGVMHFRNTGNAPLQILRIFSECGCTVPSYSSEDVMPGETGEIRIRFNGKNRDAGSFRKALRIRSNADNHREVLIVQGRIE